MLLPLASLELVAAEYLHETNISNFICHLFMVTCFIDALEKSSKRKEMRITKSRGVTTNHTQ